jgi:hypothetical protein
VCHTKYIREYVITCTICSPQGSQSASQPAESPCAVPLLAWPEVGACAAAAGAVKIPLRDVLGACWKVLLDERLPVFQLALLVIPIISEQNKAMVWGSTAKGVSNATDRVCVRLGGRVCSLPFLAWLLLTQARAGSTWVFCKFLLMQSVTKRVSHQEGDHVLGCV